MKETQEIYILCESPKIYGIMRQVTKIFYLNHKMDLTSKHHELSSSFRCYTIEAAMEFFHMDGIADTPTKNWPNYAFMTTEEQKQNYFQETFDRFIDEYVIGGDDANQSEPGDAGSHADHASAAPTPTWETSNSCSFTP